MQQRPPMLWPLQAQVRGHVMLLPLLHLQTAAPQRPGRCCLPLPAAAQGRSCLRAARSLLCAAAVAAAAGPRLLGPATAQGPHCIDTKAWRQKGAPGLADRSRRAARASTSHSIPGSAARQLSKHNSSGQAAGAHVSGAVQVPPYCCGRCSGATSRSSSS